MANIQNWADGDLYSAQKAKSYIDAKNQSVAEALMAIRSLMGEVETRLSALEDKTIDSVMSDSSENAVQNKIIKEYIDLNSGASSAFASMFELGLSDTYHINTDSDATNTVSSALNLTGFNSAIGTSGVQWKTPTVIIPDISWSDTVDDNYDFTASCNVRVRFGDAGVVSKTVTFKKPGPGKLYAVKPSNGAIIDTGIAANYAYKYHVKGHTQQGNQCVLADAFVDTSSRATVRILGGSNKGQIMWPSNKEVTNATSGINFNKMFEMTVGANTCVLTQGGSVYNAPLSGHTASGTIDTNILLLGSSVSGYNNGVMCFAEILDGSNNTLAYFAPYILESGEIVMVNTYGITAQQIYDIVENGDDAEMSSRIFRPSVGSLVEVTQAEDTV